MPCRNLRLLSQALESSDPDRGGRTSALTLVLQCSQSLHLHRLEWEGLLEPRVQSRRRGLEACRGPESPRAIEVGPITLKTEGAGRLGSPPLLTRLTSSPRALAFE